VIGFSDIRKVVSWRNELVTRTEKSKDGEPVLMPRVTIVDADKISDEAAAAVAEVWQTVNGALRVKMHDKHAALVSLGKHLGLFTDNVQIQRKHAAKVVSRPC
jgi:phage terminase small subunit